MTRSIIPKKFLNTKLHIIRDETSINDMGDVDAVKKIVYDSIDANVQPETVLGGKDNLQFEIRGKVYQPTHKAYFNRFNGDVEKKIIGGDYAIDIETGENYLIIGVLEYKAQNRGVKNSHHIKLILRVMDGSFEVNHDTSIASRANIVV